MRAEGEVTAERKREQAEEDIMFLVAQGADSLGEVLWPRQGKARCLARCVSWLEGHEDGWLRDAQEEEGGSWPLCGRLLYGRAVEICVME